MPVDLGEQINKADGRQLRSDEVCNRGADTEFKIEPLGRDRAACEGEGVADDAADEERRRQKCQRCSRQSVGQEQRVRR